MEKRIILGLGIIVLFGAGVADINLTDNKPVGPPAAVNYDCMDVTSEIMISDEAISLGDLRCDYSVDSVYEFQKFQMQGVLIDIGKKLVLNDTCAKEISERAKGMQFVNQTTEGFFQNSNAIYYCHAVSPA